MTPVLVDSDILIEISRGADAAIVARWIALSHSGMPCSTCRALFAHRRGRTVRRRAPKGVRSCAATVSRANPCSHRRGRGSSGRDLPSPVPSESFCGDSRCAHRRKRRRQQRRVVDSKPRALPHEGNRLLRNRAGLRPRRPVTANRVGATTRRIRGLKRSAWLCVAQEQAI